MQPDEERERLPVEEHVPAEAHDAATPLLSAHALRVEVAVLRVFATRPHPSARLRARASRHPHRLHRARAEAAPGPRPSTPPHHRREDPPDLRPPLPLPTLLSLLSRMRRRGRTRAHRRLPLDGARSPSRVHAVVHMCSFSAPASARDHAPARHVAHDARARHVPAPRPVVPSRRRRSRARR